MSEETKYAQAWKAFKEANPDCFDISTIGTLEDRYLVFRLKLAFEYGYNSAIKHERTRIMAGIEAVMKTT